ncbi:hypothetical protein HDU99_007492, partial [Rhizoclosmatium hyalinum]
DYKPIGDAEKGERPDGDFAHLLRILSDVPEFNELPVRHNEDKMNQTLEDLLPVPVMIFWKPGMELFGGVPENLGYEDPHVKAFLLLQAHLTRVKTLPCSDYNTDTTSVLDQSIRVMQAMVDISADKGILGTTLGVVKMMQAIKQARWPSDSDLLTLPHVTEENVEALKTHKTKPITSLLDLCKMPNMDVVRLFSTLPGVRSNHAQEIATVIANMPLMEVTATVEGSRNKNGVWEVDCGKEYELKVQLKRTRLPTNTRGAVKELRIHSPKFPKAQYEGWFVILGKEDKDELVALKRVAASGDASNSGNITDLRCSMKFSVSMDPGPMDLVVVVNSDGYLGLDQRITVRLLASFKA